MSKKIVLISCVSKKLRYKAQAQELYISSLFKMNLVYAKTFSPDQIYILSAKYGLLELTDQVEPYDVTLNTMLSNQIKDWAERVITQLRAKDEIDLENDNFIFLAGMKYRKHLLPHLAKYEVPMKGLRIGKQLQYLKRKLAAIQ